MGVSGAYVRAVETGREPWTPAVERRAEAALREERERLLGVER